MKQGRDVMAFSTSLRVAIKSLTTLLLFVGCSASQPSDKATSSSAGELSSNVSSSGDTVALSNASPSAPAATYLDSANVFDPDGYYFVKEDVRIDERKVSWLQLHTVDYYYDGKLHYDRPKLVQPPEVVLAVAIPNSSKHSMHACTGAVITRDSLSVRCVVTPESEVTIDGQFLDKVGQYSDKLAYENNPTVLLVARVAVTKDRKLVHDRVHHFTYSSGD
jgi:hypothetical protein